MDGVHCELLRRYGDECIWVYGVTVLRLGKIECIVSLGNKLKCNVGVSRNWSVDCGRHHFKR